MGEFVRLWLPGGDDLPVHGEATYFVVESGADKIRLLYPHILETFDVPIAMYRRGKPQTVQADDTVILRAARQAYDRRLYTYQMDPAKVCDRAALAALVEHLGQPIPEPFKADPEKPAPKWAIEAPMSPVKAASPGKPAKGAKAPKQENTTRGAVDEGDEVKRRMSAMTSITEVQSVAKKNGLKWDANANPGIMKMRTGNALRQLFKKGVAIKW